MSLLLSKEQKTEMIASMRRFFVEKLDLEFTEVQAAFLLDYFAHEVAPFAYNQGVEDAQKYLIRSAEDLPGSCFQEPLTYWDVDQFMTNRPEQSLEPTPNGRILSGRVYGELSAT